MVDYTAVPNPAYHGEGDADYSAPPALGEADIGERGSFVSTNSGPEPMHDNSLLGGNRNNPAPSIMSRDSTYGSLNSPGLGGVRDSTMSGHQSRASWGSGKAFGAADATLPAGAEGSRVPRGQSGLSQGYTSPFPDDVDSQGHHAPSSAVPTTDKEMPAWAAGSNVQRKPKSRKAMWLALGALLLCIIGVGVGVGLGIAKPWKNHSGSSTDKSQETNSLGQPTGTAAEGTATKTSTATAAPTATSGTKGSKLTFDDGTTATYDNDLGGTWVWDEANPTNNAARCNAWTPPLNQNWTWGVDVVHGVNLGGWLNTEPFIVPSLYEIYANGSAGTAVDEYTLSQNMGDNITAAMTEHYDTFITERDFYEIASAGLNWVRLPIPHWAIKTWDGEPYLEGVAWQYVLKAIKWARKYGIRINLDLHTVPGSQNGWNHSGRIGNINFLNGPMGLANAQRSLDYIRTLAQFIAQPEYAPVIGMFGFINEPNGNNIGQGPVGSFYYEAYNTIREITGFGEGNGPMISIHDAFVGVTKWYDFGRGADRIALDQHPYLVFQDQPVGSNDVLAAMPCQSWAASTNTSQSSFGATTAGEFSCAINDCGKWVNGVNLGQRYDGTYDGYAGKAIGSCDTWNDYTKWDDATKTLITNWAASSMDALQNWFFWTWKIGNSTDPAVPMPNPMWHYRLGWQQGWLPKDPRSVQGTCAGHGVSGQAFNGFSSPWMTGGGGNFATLANDATYAWPPQSFTNVNAAAMASIPQYTQTADPITLAAGTYTAPGSTQTADMGNGWYNPNDSKRKGYAAVSGCQYQDEYSAATSAIPQNACGAGITQPLRRSVDEKRAQPTRRALHKERAPVPGPTAAPHAS